MSDPLLPNNGVGVPQAAPVADPNDVDALINSLTAATGGPGAFTNTTPLAMPVDLDLEQLMREISAAPLPLAAPVPAAAPVSTPAAAPVALASAPTPAAPLKADSGDDDDLADLDDGLDDDMDVDMDALRTEDDFGLGGLGGLAGGAGADVAQGLRMAGIDLLGGGAAADDNGDDHDSVATTPVPAGLDLGMDLAALVSDTPSVGTPAPTPGPLPVAAPAPMPIGLDELEALMAVDAPGSVLPMLAPASHIPSRPPPIPAPVAPVAAVPKPRRTDLLPSRPAFDESKRQRLYQLFPELADRDPTISFTMMFGAHALFRMAPRARDYRGRYFAKKLDELTPEDDEKHLFETGKTHRSIAAAAAAASGKPTGMMHLPDLPDEEDSDLSSNDDLSDLNERESLLKYLPIALASWEDDIVWDGDAPEALAKDAAAEHPVLAKIQELERANPRMSILPVRNAILDSDEWLLHWDDEEWVAEPDLPFIHDPTLLLPGKATVHAPPPVPLPATHDDVVHAVDRFHLSNDDAYVVQKKAENPREASQIVLQHAPPALRLVPAYYRTELQARELRHLHRPKLPTLVGADIKFTKLKALKKKKIKGKENVELLKTPRDLTLRDTGNYTLFEYSEESPLLLSNPGMASFLFNYYRKKDDKDTYSPQLDIGAPNILEPDAQGPFWGFGDVDKGQTQQVLFNNMIRAPLFRHTPPETDFLLIRHTHKNVTRYYLREIPTIFTVGQIMPALEIAPPTSRIYTEYKRNRIRIAVYRLLKKRPEHMRKGIKFQDVQNMFPHYAEVQLKSRLKEFMEGRGLQSGHWRLKGGATVPSEEEIRKMVTPEQVCMYETMAAFQRRIDDLGYAQTEGEKDMNQAAAAAAAKSQQQEEELAPWKLTKNFASAIANKLLLKLDGHGDPTGCGQGFSFLRATPREKFGKPMAGTQAGGVGGGVGGAGGVQTEEQAAAYHRQIREIWERQVAALSSPVATDPPLEQLLVAQDVREHEKLTRQRDAAASAAAAGAGGRVGGAGSSAGVGAPAVRDEPGKVLIIRRQLKGMTEWQEEIVRDPKVIAAYTKLKKQLANAGEGSALDKFRRQKVMSEAVAISNNQIQEVLRNAREVKCRRCGQIGHIKTNREKCPAWKEEEKAKVLEGAAKRRKTNAAARAAAKEKNPVAAAAAAQAILDANDDEFGATSASPATRRTRRRQADMDMMEIFDSILVGVATMPEAKQFMVPLSAKAHPEYYARIKHPRFIQTIIENNKRLQYATADEFLKDIKLIHTNAVAIYGAEHAVAQAAANLGAYVVREVEHRSERLQDLAVQIQEARKAKRKAPVTRRSTTASSSAAAKSPPSTPAAASSPVPPPIVPAFQWQHPAAAAPSWPAAAASTAAATVPGAAGAPMDVGGPGQF
ncbi:hypothetical protein GGF31_001078 [Allomyces arbusculus]|nr:hypothetical protein GGF31_001078 [Allomyces arbusculus]